MLSLSHTHAHLPRPSRPSNNNQVESALIGIHSVSYIRLVLPFFSPCSITRRPLTQQQEQAHLTVVQDTLLHGKTLFVVPTVDDDHRTLPLFTQSIPWLSASHREYKVCVHRPFQWASEADGWEGDTQLHLDTADCLGGATKKKAVFFLITVHSSSLAASSKDFTLVILVFY